MDVNVPAQLFAAPAQLITAPAHLITAPAHLITAPAQPPATGVVYTALFGRETLNGMVHYRPEYKKKNRKNTHLIIYFPTSEGVSKVSEQSEQAKQAGRCKLNQ